MSAGVSQCRLLGYPIQSPGILLCRRQLLMGDTLAYANDR